MKRYAAIPIAMGFALCGCDRPAPNDAVSKPAPPVATTAPAAPPKGFKPAQNVQEATADKVAAAVVERGRNAAEKRAQWSDKTFEEFERSVYKEPFAGGKYIVNGDVAIADRKQLEEFFNDGIKPTRVETAGNKLIINQSGGVDTVWNTAKKKQLAYCISDTFGSHHDKVVADVAAATKAWSDIADVAYVHIAAEDANCMASNDNVVFDVRPVDVDGDYLARAFFPNEPRATRNVLIDKSSFDLALGGKLQLVGILRHELGHTLGFRHEHTRPESGTCFEDNNWSPLTSYDSFSVMHYPQCNGAGDWSLQLTDLDKDGAACIYSPGPDFHGDLANCTRAPIPSSTSGAVKTETFDAQSIAKGDRKPFGPFAAKFGTIFEATMTPAGASPGDPDLYVRMGRAPQLTNGRYSCRPYLTGANEVCSLDVPALTAPDDQVFVMVHGYDAGTYNLTVKYIPRN